VAAGAPYLDSVYKLVEYEGRPVAKLSTAKETLPGRKQVWRRPEGDVIGLRDEDGPPGAEPLLSSVMEGGRRLGREGWEAARDRLARELAALPDRMRSLDASPPAVDRSADLRRMSDDVRARLLAEEVG
jgi:nicotinate phosphoribosyltransferase